MASSAPYTRDALLGRLGNRRRLLLFAAALAVCLMLVLSLRPAQQSSGQSGLATGLAVGQPAPDFTLRDLQSQPIHLRALRGHVVLLNFWATWCQPCRLEMPDLERTARHYQAASAGHAANAPLILGIDAGGEDRTTVARFARQVHVTYPLLLDPILTVTFSTYQVDNIPFTLIVDARGVIRQAHLGPLTYAEMTRAIDGAR